MVIRFVLIPLIDCFQNSISHVRNFHFFDYVVGWNAGINTYHGLRSLCALGFVGGWRWVHCWNVLPYYWMLIALFSTHPLSLLYSILTQSSLNSITLTFSYIPINLNSIERELGVARSETILLVL